MPRRTRPIPRKRTKKISTRVLIKRDRVCFTCKKYVARTEANRTAVDAFLDGQIVKTPKLIHTDCKVQRGL